jgi:ribosomal-protein-alanine N-acetyltransferase
MALELRAAQRADAPALARIAALGLAEAWSAAAFDSALAAPTCVGLVAESAPCAGPVGYALGARVLDELEIVSLAVHPGHRRHGVATRLVDALLRAQQACGARHARLEVRASNAAARALYARCGFRLEGRRRRYYTDGDDALLLGTGL